ncbi:hypothetical protein ACP275_08G049700 [Erythranthe tilingii]
MARFSVQKPFSPNSWSRFPLFNRRLHTNPQLTDQFLSLLPFCRKNQDLRALKSLLILHGLITHQPLIKQFISQCCNVGFPDLALSAFKTIETPSLYLQNLLLRTLSDNGLFEDVVLVYRKCRNSGLSSDNYTYPFVVKACAVLCDVRFGNTVHCSVLRTGFGENLVVQTALLDFYSKVGEMANARKLFDEIPQPDSVAWNALISGYSLNGLDYEVLRVFQDMRFVGVKPNASTLASIFPVFSRAAVNDIAISLHGLAYKLGYSEDESLVPALISMYANCGDLSAARDVFDTSSRKNAAIWNAVISAYTRNHKPENALSMFQTMITDEMKPNIVTFVSLLPSSENLGIRCIESFHTYVIKFGFEKEISIITALLSVYAKLGNIDSAKFFFHNVRLKNRLLWNSMVSAYAGNGVWGRSLDSFSLMQKDGFKPDSISIISVLSSCSGLKATLLGKSAHAFTIKNDIDSNLNVSNAFLAFYCNCCELVYSFRIFDRMVLKSVVSWNTMISGCVNNGELERAMLVFDRMRQNVNFDLVTLISILPSCHENPILGLNIHSFAVKTGLTTDVSLCNALVSIYVNCGDLDSVRLVFDDMPRRTVVSWNAILTGCRLHNLQTEAIELFKEMTKEEEEEDRKPNYVTLLNVLPSCYTLLQGKSIHAYAFRRWVPLETPLLTSLMIMYARFENLASCTRLFSVGDKTNISLWNTIISSHLLSQNGASAFSFFIELLRNEINPDDVTILNLVSACVHLKSLQISNSVLSYVVRKGFDKDVAVRNSLIDMYAKCGSISTARMLFEDGGPRTDPVSWSSIINGYGLHGDGVEALALYSRMKLLNLRPDKVTYTSILSACSHAGLFEQGLMVFDAMIGDGILPGVEHYGCMVDLLGRTGRLDEAYEIVKNLPGGSNVNALESVLGACLSHGNYSLGEEIGRHLLVLDVKKIKDCGPYVILHNIYAAAGKWVEANNVRMVMQQKQFSKDPGFSFGV